MHYPTPIEIIIWKKPGNFLECSQKWNGTNDYLRYIGGLGGALLQKLSIAAPDTKNIFVFFVTNDCSNVRYMKDKQLEHDEMLGLDCKWEPILFVQRLIFENLTTLPLALCISKMYAKRAVFWGEVEPLLRRVNDIKVQTSLMSLDEMSFDGLEGCTSTPWVQIAELIKKSKREAPKQPKTENRENKNANNVAICYLRYLSQIPNSNGTEHSRSGTHHPTIFLQSGAVFVGRLYSGW